MPKRNRSSRFLAEAQQSPFPDPRQADADGLLAVGGALTPDWLVAAYSRGIFPWFDDDSGPLMWWSPDPRAVIEPGRMRVSRSLQRTLRRQEFTVSMDLAFSQVIGQCARTRSETGTWITADMQHAYTQLHTLGLAHSVETWRNDRLVGGLYGISLGRMFFGESMFALETDASKVAFAALHAQLALWQFALIDCQLPNPHLRSLGVASESRNQFLARLAANQAAPTHRGAWQLEERWLDRALAMRGTA